MPQPPIHFHFPEGKASLRDRTLVKEVIAGIFKTEKRQLTQLDYVFCSDSTLLEMNKQWLRHDTYTDIITFDLSDSPGLVRGEVYISTDRVKENAKQFGTTVQDELRRVIFHGALHLCGYKDKSKAQQVEMRRQEDKWLKAANRST